MNSKPLQPIEECTHYENRLTTWSDFGPASEASLMRVHTKEYLEGLCLEGGAEAFAAAVRAAGAVCHAIDQVCSPPSRSFATRVRCVLGVILNSNNKRA